MISNRPCRVADNERIRVVVEKDHQAHEPDSHLTADRGLRPAHDDAHDTGHAAVARDDADHAADHHREQDDRRVIGIGEGIHDKDRENLEEAFQCAEWRKALQGRRTEPQSQQQGRYDVANDEGDRDGKKRRHQRDPSRQNPEVDSSHIAVGSRRYRHSPCRGAGQVAKRCPARFVGNTSMTRVTDVQRDITPRRGIRDDDLEGYRLQGDLRRSDIERMTGRWQHRQH